MQLGEWINILRIRSGMSPGMALGFFWALGGLFFQGRFFFSLQYLTSCCRTKRIISVFSWPCQDGSTYRGAIWNFWRKMVCIRLSHCANLIRMIYSRVQVLFCSMVSGFDNVHIRANLPLLDQAIKYGNSSGDRWCDLTFRPLITFWFVFQDVYQPRQHILYCNEVICLWPSYVYTGLNFGWFQG